MRLVCHTCQSALSIALTQTIQIPKDCPVCKVHWQDAASHGSADAAEAFANALKAWIQVARDKKPPFTLALELDA